jgi:hypothetical protein
MSIREQWKERVKEGRLFKLGFGIPGPAERRIVLMSPEIAELVSGLWENTLMGDRCARLRADLENYLEGAPLTVCWQPFKGRDHHQIARLKPVEAGVWDVRSVDPSPALRVFFCLAEKDVMVALTCSPRSVPVSWLERPPLGPRECKRWKRAISECKREWGILFPGYTPYVGERPDDCISKAIID